MYFFLLLKNIWHFKEFDVLVVNFDNYKNNINEPFELYLSIKICLNLLFVNCLHFLLWYHCTIWKIMSRTFPWVVFYKVLFLLIGNLNVHQHGHNLTLQENKKSFWKLKTDCNHTVHEWLLDVPQQTLFLPGSNSQDDCHWEHAFNKILCNRYKM